MMYLERRAPYSDWRAQVERQVERQVGVDNARLCDCRQLQNCYDCGLSPSEVAEDIVADIAR